MEEALFLTRFASKVTLIHRRDEFRASKIMVDRVLADPKIEVAWNFEVAEILGEEQATGLRLKNTVDGHERLLDVAGIFIAIGHDPRSALVAEQVATDSDGYVKVEHPSTQTSLAGVFAAGDLVDHTYRQAITAAGTGCAAAQDAQHFLSSLIASEQRSDFVLEVSA